MRNILVCGLIALLSGPLLAGTKVTIDENGVLVIDGKKTFVLSTSLPPMPGAKTPEGKDGLGQLKEDGLNLTRIRPPTGPQKFEEADIRSIGQWLDACAAQKLYCWVTLGHLPTLKDGDPKRAQNEKLLRLAIELYKDHPALAVWKGYDEPAWVKMPADPLVNSYKLFKQLDPNHPVIIIQAPTKASLPLEPYAAAGDIHGIDVYPVTYPPGNHSDFGNRELSIVSDCTQWVRKSAGGKPVWMTLQIAWAGTATPGKRIRFPSLFQQRYMAYAAIINGARGLNYQGGERPLALNERDAKLGWNWTFWYSVMRPLLAELNESSPLHPALVGADSKLPIRVEGATDVEFVTREVGQEIFILAARREGQTSKVKFTGLPQVEAQGAVLFEEPQKIEVKEGAFEDWFGPNDVHVYKLKRR